MNTISRSSVQLATNNTTTLKLRNIFKSIIFTTLISLNCQIWWIPMLKYPNLNHHNNYWPTSQDFSTLLSSHKNFSASNLTKLIIWTNTSFIMRNLTKRKVTSRSNHNLHNLLNLHFNSGQKTLIFTTVLTIFSAQIIPLMSMTLQKVIP